MKVPTPTFERLYASIYDDLYQEKPYALEVEFFLSHISLDNKVNFNLQRVLDFGCGTGNHAWEFCVRGYEVTGIDPSPDMIDIAKKKYQDTENINFLVGRENVVPMEDFDLVSCLFNVFGYYSAFSDPRILLDNFQQRLANNAGWLIIDFWDKSKMLAPTASKSVKTYITKIGEARRITSSRFIDRDLLEIDMEWQINGPSHLFAKEKHTLRVFDSIQMEHLLMRAGFNNIREVRPPSGEYQDKRSSTFIACA